MTEFKVGDLLLVRGPILGIGMPDFVGVGKVSEVDPGTQHNLDIRVEGDTFHYWVNPAQCSRVPDVTGVKDPRPFKLGDVVQLTCGGVHMTVTGAIGDPMYDGKLRTTVAVDTGILRQDFGGQRGPDCRHYAPECLVLVRAVD